jgi:hypothetical protein
MTKITDPEWKDSLQRFDRNFLNSEHTFTLMGDGEIGGKAIGLAFIREKISEHFKDNCFKGIIVEVPRLSVITTRFFEQFMSQNHLYDVALEDLEDERITHHFLKAELPPELVGDLMALIDKVHTPLAIRSSSLLEDALNAPFAGIYETKMIPNNQPESSTRFRKLTEAIKFVYASTFFKKAKGYMKATGNNIKNEKMAVIIQEIVGLDHNKRFYPSLSGVAKSYNFYPVGEAKPEEGVVDLALGLGKTIVDGGTSWTYSPSQPRIGPPFNSIGDMMKQTQLTFWAVNMSPLKRYDPLKETEYMIQLELSDAEYDNTLTYIASTYDYQADRVNIGVGTKGPRIINFAPILDVELIAMNPLLEQLMALCDNFLNEKVEIEFAMVVDKTARVPVKFGFLQVRPMLISTETVEISEHEIQDQSPLLYSENVMGNGCKEDICDIIYVNPDTFNLKYSLKIAGEIGVLNRALTEEEKSYLLIGFGRWGSSDPWLGIPVGWDHISGAKAILESSLPQASKEMSQGSHFFHNISNLQIFYFSTKHTDPYPIDWKWLEQQKPVRETEFCTHIRLSKPLTLKVDGRKKRGIILK